MIFTTLMPIFLRNISAIEHLLHKAHEHVQTNSIEPTAILYARLYPDMFHLVRQIQIACDFCKYIGRLSNKDVPKFEDTEQSFDELFTRIANTKAFLLSLTDADFIDAATKTVEFKAPNFEKKYIGITYVHDFLLPNLYFHMSMFYAILRHSGVKIGKMDFYGGSWAA